MIRRFYVHNFRCLENFELPLAGQPSVLMIGKNGSGKSTVGQALEILQKIARGTNRVRDLVREKDLARGRIDIAMRFEIEVDLKGQVYQYSLAIAWLHEAKGLRVVEEKLSVDGEPIFGRSYRRVSLVRTGGERTVFEIDWQLVALPLLQPSASDPISVLQRWLARMLILRPIPSLIRGDSDDETLEPNSPVTDFGAWFSGLLAEEPRAYTRMDEYLKHVMPDLTAIRNPVVGSDARSITVQFSSGDASVTVPFEDLSDGEKCFMICAMVLASNDAYGPLFCFWDEPDNYLSPSEVGHFVLALRKAFQSGGQFLTTSHNLEAIRRFSNENTLLLYRNSHLEPTLVRRLDDLEVNGNLVNALVRGDLEP